MAGDLTVPELIAEIEDMRDTVEAKSEQYQRELGGTVDPARRDALEVALADMAVLRGKVDGLARQVANYVERKKDGLTGAR